MLDGVMLRMVEEATHAGYPMDANAVLLIELEGLEEAVEEQAGKDHRCLYRVPGRERCVSRSRKRSARCVGRAARTRSARWAGSARRTTCRDGVVPRTRIADTLRFIYEVSEKYGLTISNIFHAGDGNMHPIICLIRVSPTNSRRPSRPGRRFSTTASRPGARSPASTAWHGEERPDAAGV